MGVIYDDHFSNRDITDLECFAIYVEGHNEAEYYIPRLLANARSYGWNLTPYPGVDGRKMSCEKHLVKIDDRHKKVRKQMAKSGVQGCFLSHFRLWNECINLHKPIGIFEFDVKFTREPPKTLPDGIDVLKLAGFEPAKPVPTGQWWGGAYAYILTPMGAKKLLDWVFYHGASPADFMLADGVLDVGFDTKSRVELNSQGISTTENW
jgi:hypothetical protein